jgi:5-methyltetrahydropteroyltriglutamate--homocysteine methyltransferase
MKKWITSNYHYMVPECDTEEPLQPDLSPFLADVKRGIAKLGADCATPVVVGPVTVAYLTKFASFSTGFEKEQRRALLHKLLPIYKQLLADVAALGVSEIQIHEGALVMEDDALLPLFQDAYPAILPVGGGPAINMVSFMEDVGASHYKWLSSVQELSVLSLDFTRGDTLKLIQEFGFPQGKTLGAGIIDARSVWSIDPLVVKPILQAVLPLVGEKIRIQPTASLQFVPWDLSGEKDILVHPAGGVLSFATQKLKEVAIVAEACSGNMAVLDKFEQAWTKYRAVASAPNSAVGQRISKLTEKDFARAESFELRRPKQLPGTPILPTTTIGSFPQTRAVRLLRTQRKKGLLSQKEYENAIDQQIALAIGIQEGLGLVRVEN